MMKVVIFSKFRTRIFKLKNYCKIIKIFLFFFRIEKTKKGGEGRG